LIADYTLVIQPQCALLPFRVILELDGIQHFEPTYFGGQVTDDGLIRTLKNQQEKDKYQDEFCIARGYKVMRISHSVPLITFGDVIEHMITSCCQTKRTVLSIFKGDEYNNLTV